MSTLPLSVTRLAQVRETMRSASYWTERISRHHHRWQGVKSLLALFV